MRHILPAAFSALLFVTAVFLSATPQASAVTSDEMEKARDRIIERLPEMGNLWNRGLTGESNEGFVVARSSLRSDQIAMMQNENRDRLILYSYIAEKTGAKLAEVFKVRAKRIAEMAHGGLWVQTPDGHWKRK